MWIRRNFYLIGKEFNLGKKVWGRIGKERPGGKKFLLHLEGEPGRGLSWGHLFFGLRNALEGLKEEGAFRGGWLKLSFPKVPNSWGGFTFGGPKKEKERKLLRFLMLGPQPKKGKVLPEGPS